MSRFVAGRVTDVFCERRGLQKVRVEGHPAYVLTDLVGPVAVGDRVVVNTTAVDLGLGTGGWHFVHWNLAVDEVDVPGGGPVMKLRYTSLQHDAGAAEETGPFYPATTLAGLPVVACDLHSQLGPVAGAFAAGAPGKRLVYVMTDSAALPVALSDQVYSLVSDGLLAATVSVGQAFGGDFEAVNIYSALQVADVMAGADAVVVAPGPGVVGTRSQFGFSGMEVLGVVDATNRLGGRALLAARWSDADGRPEHRGLSHHTVTCLSLMTAAVEVPVPFGGSWPEGITEEIDYTLVSLVPLPEFDGRTLGGSARVTASTMGRGPGEDPGFFAWSAAAGLGAARLVVGAGTLRLG
ncbi:MAG: DUF3866 family protein [Acidimicrobiales bacterium]